MDISRQLVRNSPRDGYNYTIGNGRVGLSRRSNSDVCYCRVRHYSETKYNKPIDLNKLKNKFYKEVDKYALNKMISIDETLIHAETTNNYSKCELGKRS